MNPQSPASPALDRPPFYKLLIVLFLLAIATASAIPQYLAGNWTLDRVAEVPQSQSLRTLQKTGLTLPNWQTQQQQTLEIGGHKWSVQALTPLSPSPQPLAPLLMLRPQTWHRDFPQVDWMDINGARGWTEDQERSITFSVTPAGSAPIPINARLLRGWTDDQTYAVLQWYAWKSGGDAAPSQWFWAEQRSQLGDRQHLGWVGVCLLLPMPPLGEIESAQAEIEALGKLVHATLITDILK